MTIYKNVDLQINLTPKELAEEFCLAMNTVEQAEFFNQLAVITSSWPGTTQLLATQLHAISNCPALRAEGRVVMRAIGRHSGDC